MGMGNGGRFVNCQEQAADNIMSHTSHRPIVAGLPFPVGSWDRCCWADEVDHGQAVGLRPPPPYQLPATVGPNGSGTG